jgi:hypothetical protein
MTPTFNKYYPYQVWLTSLILMPVLLLLHWGHYRDGILSAFSGITLMVGIGAVLSIPAFIIYFISFKTFRNFGLHPVLTKGILCIIALLGVVITFRLIAAADTDLGYDATMFYIICTLSIFIPGLLFKLGNRKPALPITQASSNTDG